jgi:hypothetical protein
MLGELFIATYLPNHRKELVSVALLNRRLANIWNIP